MLILFPSLTPILLFCHWINCSKFCFLTIFGPKISFLFSSTQNRNPIFPRNISKDTALLPAICLVFHFRETSKLLEIVFSWKTFLRTRQVMKWLWSLLFCHFLALSCNEAIQYRFTTNQSASRKIIQVIKVSLWGFFTQRNLIQCTE